MPAIYQLRKLASFLFVCSGFSKLAKMRRHGQPCILMFHGVRADGDMGLLDSGLHIEHRVFRNVCAYLAQHFNVVPLSEIIDSLKTGHKLPECSVALTFDDGYASNYHLAFPVLKQFGLHATIFPATGFLDQTEMPWFLRLEYAVAKSPRTAIKISHDGRPHTMHFNTMQERAKSLAVLQERLKALPQEKIIPEMNRLEEELECGLPAAEELPDIFRPMSWDQARELHHSGHVELGGHTHRHLILGHCRKETAQQEITECRDRLTAEIGVAPRLFAYPNGQVGDHTPDTADLLEAAGFTAAVTTSAGAVRKDANLFTLPRYGSPLSQFHAEAVVTGSFETIKEIRNAPFSFLFAPAT